MPEGCGVLPSGADEHYSGLDIQRFRLVDPVLALGHRQPDHCTVASLDHLLEVLRLACRNSLTESTPMPLSISAYFGPMPLILARSFSTCTIATSS